MGENETIGIHLDEINGLRSGRDKLHHFLAYGLKPAMFILDAALQKLASGEEDPELYGVFNEVACKLDQMKAVVEKWDEEMEPVPGKKAPETKSSRKGSSGAKE